VLASFLQYAEQEMHPFFIASRTNGLTGDFVSLRVVVVFRRCGYYFIGKVSSFFSRDVSSPLLKRRGGVDDAEMADVDRILKLF